MIYWIIVYWIGFLVCYLILFLFGKRMGYDYSMYKERDYSNFDDWTSNSEAYFNFSIFWFLFLIINLIYFSYKFCCYLSSKVVKD